MSLDGCLWSAEELAAADWCEHDAAVWAVWDRSAREAFMRSVTFREARAACAGRVDLFGVPVYGPDGLSPENSPMGVWERCYRRAGGREYALDVCRNELVAWFRLGGLGDLDSRSPLLRAVGSYLYGGDLGRVELGRSVLYGNVPGGP